MCAWTQLQCSADALKPDGAHHCCFHFSHQPADKTSRLMQDDQKPPATHGDALYHKNQLTEGDKLVSKDGEYALTMQRDGNLVCYYKDRSIWSSHTHGKGCGPYRLIMQQDRNLVIYANPNSPIWSSGTCNHGVAPACVVMQNDGNIVIYDGNHKSIWSTGIHKK